MIYGCGLAPLWSYGIFGDIYKSDVTNISLVIYAVFAFAIVVLGFTSWRVSNKRDKALTDKYVDMGWFLSETMMTLGLIGTVAGMIYLFGQIFNEIDPSNPDDLKEALGHMATGLSTAMYTTIVGMVCALLTRIQLMNIDYGQE